MPDQAAILILNGPNLNMLGVREPTVYGSETLGDIEESCKERANHLGLGVDFRQSNHEGELIDAIQEARENHKGIIINPAGYTHTSVAIRDALLISEVPIIEVHLSNVFQREEFRHHSYVTPVSQGVICGLGPIGYLLALEAMSKILEGSD